MTKLDVPIYSTPSVLLILFFAVGCAARPAAPTTPQVVNDESANPSSQAISSDPTASEAATSHAPTRKPAAAKAVWNVAVVVHDGVELLDFAGPGEVFAAASRSATKDNKPWFNVYTVAPSKDEILSQGFVRITPEYSIEDAPAPDFIIIPGGKTGILTDDAAFMSWVEQSASGSSQMLTVCTGAFVPAKLGMLRGKKATTHWGSVAFLRESQPSIDVVENVRFVDSGAIVTTAGVSAGIDGALHVVAKTLGHRVARSTARYMEYEWRPKRSDIATYKEWNPQLDKPGQALQKGRALITEEQWTEAARYYKSLDGFDHSFQRWLDLGYAHQKLGQLADAAASYRRAIAMTGEPLLWMANYHLAQVLARSNSHDEALAALERSLALGFDSYAYIESDPQLASLHDLEAFKRILSAAKSAAE